MSEQSIQSLERAFKILEYLVSGEKTLTEISRFVGLSQAGTLKILRTLCTLGYVDKGGNGLYLPGMAACILARGYLQRFSLVQMARPHMERLSHAFGGRTVLSVLRGCDQLNMLQVDVAMRNHEDDLPLLVGRGWPYATGRVLLASSPAAVVDEHLEKYPLMPVMPETSSPANFGEELAEIREKGYAVVKHSDQLVDYVAVPLRGIAGGVIAALGANLHPGELLEDSLRLLSDAAERIMAGETTRNGEDHFESAGE